MGDGRKICAVNFLNTEKATAILTLTALKQDLQAAVIAGLALPIVHGIDVVFASSGLMSIIAMTEQRFATRLSRRAMLRGGVALALGTALSTAGAAKAPLEAHMPTLPTSMPQDLSGQSVRNGSDKPILIAGKAFRFDSVDEPWAIQRFKGHDNMLRTEIRAGYKAPYDSARERPYFRSEVSEMEREGNTHVECWMAFDICMLDDAHLQPYGPDLPPGQAMICQIKTFPDAGSGAPLIRIEARSNGVRVAAAGNDGTGDIITNWMFPDPIRRDRFESFLIQIIRSPTGTADGTVRVWRDGKKIIDRQDVAIGHATTKYTWNKFGLYCRDNVTSAAAVHANMNCGPDLSHLVGRGPPSLPAG